MTCTSGRNRRLWTYLNILCERGTDGDVTKRFSTEECGHDVLILFEDILRRGADLRIKVTGTSMSPFLCGGEVLTIRKVSHSSLRRGDIIFFRNSQGDPVVHRIIRMREDLPGATALQTKGDASRALDAPVREEDVFGKVCKIERPNSVINMETTVRRGINYLTAITHLIAWRLHSFVCSLGFRS